MDDPLVIASLLPPRVLMDAQQLRWTLCASDRCFKNPATSAFFRSVKVLPVSRGDGIYQKGLDMAISKLNNGGWVHIFPEGSRSRDGGKTVRSAKRGIGRLVLDADNTPVLIPFVHTGMQEIMPIGASIPRIGKIVTVLVGDPIEFDDLLNAQGSEFASRGSLYDAISSRVGNRLQEMKSQVDKLALDQSKRMKQLAVQSMDRATEIIEHVDWESFGMKNYIMSSAEDLENSNRETQVEEEVNLSYQQQPDQDEYRRTGFSKEGGFISRIRGIVGPNDLTGFAARSTLLDHSKWGYRNGHEVNLNPIRVWKQFLEANCGTRVLLC